MARTPILLPFITLALLGACNQPQGLSTESSLAQDTTSGLTQIKVCAGTPVGSLCDGVFYDPSQLRCRIDSSEVTARNFSTGINVSCMDTAALKNAVESGSWESVQTACTRLASFPLSMGYEAFIRCPAVDSAGNRAAPGVPNEPYAISAKVFKGADGTWQISCF